MKPDAQAKEIAQRFGFSTFSTDTCCAITEHTVLRVACASGFIPLARLIWNEFLDQSLRSKKQPYETSMAGAWRLEPDGPAAGASSASNAKPAYLLDAVK